MGTQGDKNKKEFRRIGWPAIAVGGLLVITLGLELLARQTFGQTDVATLLLALYLAFWSSVLGIAGFLLLSIRWLVAWRRPRIGRTTGLEDHESLRPDVSPPAPGVTTMESDDTDRSRDFNRVA